MTCSLSLWGFFQQMRQDEALGKTVEQFRDKCPVSCTVSLRPSAPGCAVSVYLLLPDELPQLGYLHRTHVNCVACYPGQVSGRGSSGRYGAEVSVWGQGHGSSLS